MRTRKEVLPGLPAVRTMPRNPLCAARGYLRQMNSTLIVLWRVLRYEIFSDRHTPSPHFIRSNQVTGDPTRDAVVMQRPRRADVDEEGQSILREAVVTLGVADAINLTCACV